MERPRTLSSSRAFSLAELLVVIAVISILAALAIPNVAAITTQSHYAKNERNAQNIASLAGQAKAAGAQNVWNSVDDVINDLDLAIVVPLTSGQSLRFQLSGLTADDRAGVQPFLEVVGGRVYYKTASN